MATFIYVFILSSLIALSSQEGANEVNINVLFKPDDCRKAAKAGDFVTVTYVGFLPSESGSEQFDTSDNKGPVHFKLHDSQSTAMKGWHQALDGACPRERREVLIPAGELTINHNLPNTLAPPEGKDVGYRFEVRNIQDAPPAENLFKKMDLDANLEITKDEMHKYIENEGLGGLDKFETREAAVKQMFDHLDKDRDGTISHKEFPGPKHDEF